MIDNSWYGIITNTVAIVESMIRYKKTFEMKLYSGVQHAFFNETMPTYDKSAAEEAWERAVSFFSKYLRK
jgi:carboxymethylenebutenolidase